MYICVNIKLPDTIASRDLINDVFINFISHTYTSTLNLNVIPIFYFHLDKDDAAYLVLVGFALLL